MCLLQQGWCRLCRLNPKFRTQFHQGGGVADLDADNESADSDNKKLEISIDCESNIKLLFIVILRSYGSTVTVMIEL